MTPRRKKKKEKPTSFVVQRAHAVNQFCHENYYYVKDMAEGWRHRYGPGVVVTVHRRQIRVGAVRVTLWCAVAVTVVDQEVELKDDEEAEDVRRAVFGEGKRP